jgi:WhiB family transcriptional regulator, redox-sensing transcriptional regulator
VSARLGIAQGSHKPLHQAAQLRWKQYAACIGTDPAMWDDEPTRRDDATIRACRQICATCPVLEECRAHALIAGEPAGIWGGLTEPERALILKRQAGTIPPQRILVPCGTESAYHRHIRRREPIDQACRDAVATAQRQRHARRQRTNT